MRNGLCGGGCWVSDLFVQSGNSCSAKLTHCLCNLLGLQPGPNQARFQLYTGPTTLIKQRISDSRPHCELDWQ